MNRVSYKGNDKETYSLLIDGEVVGEILTGEDGAIELVQTLNDFINKRGKIIEEEELIILQNDSDYPPIGVIMDFYDKTGDNHHANTFYLFDDFI